MHHNDSTRGASRIAIVGAGALGTALAAALDAVAAALEGVGEPTPRPRLSVSGPFGRGADPTGADVVLLCVPDREIATAAAAITPGPFVGHCSGATGLEPLHPHEAFSLHPLMTVTASGADFAGATAAIDAVSDRALAVAATLAQRLGMRTVRIRAEDRVAYHTAACLASNFLVTLEAAAQRLGETAGLDREALLPLVRATVENWGALGPERALTGPIARGDQRTVSRQRDTVALRAPELLGLFDELTQATRRLAART